MTNGGASSGGPPPVPGAPRPRSATTSGHYAVAAQAQVRSSPYDQAGVLVVVHLHSLLKSRGMYAQGHPQHLQQARRFAAAIAPAFQTLGVASLALVFVDGRIFVNGRPVRPNERVVDKTTWVYERFAALGVAELRIDAGVGDEDVNAFVDALGAAESSGQALAKDVQSGAIVAHVARRAAEFDDLIANLAFTARFELLQFYAEALSTVRLWAHDIAAGALADRVAATRLAARLIDAYASDPSGLLGFVNLRPVAGSFANRRLDATIVAIAIARELGFNNEQTLELASANLIRRLPSNWVAWWVRAAGDPAHAAADALGAPDPLEAIVTFEAAAPVGLAIPSGFYGQSVQPHASTLILNVASGFVDLLQPGDASNPFSPEAALQMVVAQSGTFFEPTIVAALAQSLGAWPPGATVRLNSGDVAVVVARPRPGTASNRPFIRPIEHSQQVATYDLARPELAPYLIVGAAQRGDCPVNPMFVFVQ